MCWTVNMKWWTPGRYTGSLCVSAAATNINLFLYQRTWLTDNCRSAARAAGGAINNCRSTLYLYSSRCCIRIIVWMVVMARWPIVWFFLICCILFIYYVVFFIVLCGQCNSSWIKVKFLLREAIKKNLNLAGLLQDWLVSEFMMICQTCIEAANTLLHHIQTALGSDCNCQARWTISSRGWDSLDQLMFVHS